MSAVHSSCEDQRQEKNWNENHRTSVTGTFTLPFPPALAKAASTFAKLIFPILLFSIGPPSFDMLTEIEAKNNSSVSGS
jgi:hypothetical protein